MDRRTFITWVAGGGFALAFGPVSADAPLDSLSPWIAIGPDDEITLTTTALEMGQGSRTGQAQVLADELEAPWDRIKLVQAPEAAPFMVDGALYSGGSETLRTRYDILRLAGATARAQLVQAAATRWKVETATCKAELAAVIHEPSGRRFSYGALARDAALCAAPKDPPLKTKEQRRYIGKAVSTFAQADKVTGTARYGIDFRLPGMLFASLRQAPSSGGTLAGVDEAPALAVPGVRKVVKLEDAVAVVGDTTWAAFKGLRALDPKWTPGPGLSSPAISLALSSGLDAPNAEIGPEKGGREARERLRAAYVRSERKHEATYEIAYLAHAPLEPMNATAIASGTRAEIWAPCQSPTWLRDDVVAMTSLKKEAIVVHPLLMGGGFGRRLKGDYAGRAVQVAQAVGRPVQVVWTREEDMTHDFYRPAMRMVVRASLEPDGSLAGYEVLTATADDTTGGHRPLPYELADYAATMAKVEAGVPIGSWRAVDEGMSLFAKESFIDECAHLAGVDPLTYRDRLLGRNERARRALHAAAEAIGWSKPRQPGVGQGLALLQGWDTIVAHAVEVQVQDHKLAVVRLVAVGDCGVAVNPQQVRAQFEGGGLMGVSAALKERMTFEGGKAVQTNFDTYPVLRMREAPDVQVILLDTEGTPIGGAGEPPLPGVAPAIANAIFAACGQRIRRLPLSEDPFWRRPDGGLS
jgi:isoquinoline 1-oxidoreductase beta subunit